MDTTLVPLAAGAARLGIAAGDLRLAVERGEIPYVRVGDRGVLLPMEDVLRILGMRARASCTGAVEPTSGARLREEAAAAQPR